MDKIRKIGSVLKTDKDGFIINESSLDKIKSPWREAVEEIKKAYLDNLKDAVHSIYIRGSVARGVAIEGISDIDTLAIITKEIDRSWVRGVRTKLNKKFVFSTGIEFGFVNYNQLFEELFESRFLIKTQSVCIFGEDVSTKIEKFKADLNTSSQFNRKLKEVLNNAKNGISNNPDKEDIREWCRWVAKRILRAGFVLVMDKEQVFTRDLYPCYEIFAKYYPQQASKMYTALELAINPIDDVKTIVSFIDDFGFWLEAEVDNKFAR